MPGVLEESFHIEELELDDAVITPGVPTIPQASSPQNNLPQTDEVVDSAAMTPSTSTAMTPSTSTAMTPSTSTDVRMIQSVEEITDEKVCQAFIEQTCGCKKASGRPCSSQFSVEYYMERRAQASVMTRHELDLVMLGSIMCSTRADDDVTHR